MSIHIANVPSVNIFRGYQSVPSIAPSTRSSWRRLLDTLMTALSASAV
jgi:hypothetical protein